MSQYAAALRVWPDDETARIGIARVLVRRQNVGEAVRSLRTVLKANPSSVDGHLALAVALTRQGDVAGAIEHFREAVRLRPGFGEAQRSLERATQMLERSPGERRALPN
jgi:Flp pilus assembly protein TadD